MKIGFHLTPFWSPADRAPAAIIDEAVQVVRASSELGFAWVSMGHHWISHPTVWPQPMPMLARLAPETGTMRLKTSMLLLPLLNAVDVAENVATLDHITHGRLDLGVAIGYREKELAAAGLTRKDRVPKLEESLALMKRLWRGDEVTFDSVAAVLRRALTGARLADQQLRWLDGRLDGLRDAEGHPPQWTFTLLELSVLAAFYRRCTERSFAVYADF